MSYLQQVVRNTLNKPPIIVVHGGAGVGKTTFAAQAPDCIFIPVEDGLGMLDVATFPEPIKVNEITMMMKSLVDEDHNYQWLVIDSITAMEKKLWSDLCNQGNVSSIEELGGGYGKGFTKALEWTNQLIADMRYLRQVKSMGIILIAHSNITTVNPPDKASYDQYTLNVNKKLADFIHTQADIVAYCELEKLIKQEDKGFGQNQGKVTETGRRLLHCYSSTKYTSKNRYGIQQPIEMSFATLMNEIGNNIKGNQNA
jgi:hypothetical protein